jgi:protein ImuB
MSILCLWIPGWRTGEESLAELTPLLLEEAPRVAIEERGVVWVDVRGLSGARIAVELVRRVKERGEGEVRAGVAPVPIAAEAAARFGRLEVVEVGQGEERDFLAPLPLSLLTEEEPLLSLLEGAGLRCCGDLAGLTAEAVEVRFGSEGTRIWRSSRGDDPRLLFRPIPPERPLASVDFLDYTVRDATRLIFTLNALLDQVCELLRTRGRRARSLTLTFTLSGGGRAEEVLRTARPTADRALWMRRLRAALERIRLTDAIAAVSLEVGSLEPVSALQGDLFDRGFATASFVEEAVARLMDMYRGLFVRHRSSRHPLVECRSTWVDLTPEEVATTGGAGDEGLVPTGLELQLLSEPHPIRVRTLARRDHVVPTRYLEGKDWHTLTAAGPDRISGGHEEERPYAREYYRCVSDEGTLLWIYRDAVEDRWFLHGWWD